MGTIDEGSVVGVAVGGREEVGEEGSSLRSGGIGVGVVGRGGRGRGLGGIAVEDFVEHPSINDHSCGPVPSKSVGKGVGLR